MCSMLYSCGQRAIYLDSHSVMLQTLADILSEGNDVILQFVYMLAS